MRSRTARIAALAVLALLGVAWLIPAVLHGRGADLREAPVLLVGPDVVAQPLAVAAGSLPGRPLDVGVAATEADARAAVSGGDVVGALVLDLRATQDDVLVRDGLHPQVRARAVAGARAVEARYGRSIEVSEVPGRAVPDGAALTAAAAAVAAAYLLVAVMSMLWGPVPRTLLRGLVRIAAVGVLAGLVAAVALVAPDLRPPTDADRAPVAAAALLALLAFGAGLATLAWEALLRLHGLALAGLLLMVLPAPLLIAGHEALLGPVAAAVVRQTGIGAATAALAGLSSAEDHALLVPLVILVGNVVLALAVLVLCRAAAIRDAAAGREPEVARGTAPAQWRFRVLVGLVAVLAVATPVLMLTPTADPTPMGMASLAASTTCAETGRLETTEDLNRLTSLRDSPEFQGGDVGAEIMLQDGRTVWMFGDTLRQAGAGTMLVRNSMLVVGEDCLQVVLPEGGGAVIPDRGEVGYWPMSLTATSYPGYDLVTVFAQRVRTTGTGPFGFANVGPAVATYLVPVGGTPQLLEVRDLGVDDPDTTRPMWGAASVVDGGWLYAYGTARPPDPELGTGFSLHVARVRPEDVGDLQRWRYWDGAGWTRAADDAATLIGSEDGVSQTLSVFERDGTWYAFSKRDEVFGSDLVFWTSPSPTGPFTAQPAVAELPSDAATGQLRYMPLAHPELLPEPGSVLVSYSRNSTDLGEVMRDPLLYRPRFLRVPLPQP
ncbi:DUF4185 domain-containing protein [Nocardioides sp. GY 10113]|uniref:DUF4185 domain-containing protein n=1 Tax=Nocardioides sp. GY 10113 TaxID=2569761 RepID=UPI0010A91543|nr:DUF4185 domain-containing protein [Nocardioides sp. GY 10113]TIC88859.1 DUF4185 domain-containing protein [Nocardioides sp. GY 10113]